MNNLSFGGAGPVMNVFGQGNDDNSIIGTIPSQSFGGRSVASKASMVKPAASPIVGQSMLPQVPAAASMRSEVSITDSRYVPSSINASPSNRSSGVSVSSTKKVLPTKAKPEDAIKHKPAVLPPLKKTKALAKSAKITVTKQKVEPGRLFLRVPLEEDKVMSVGDFKVSVKLSMVDPETVQRVAKKLESSNKNKNNKKDVNMIIEAPMITLANIVVEHVPTGQIVWSSEPGVNFVGGAGNLVSQSIDTPCQEHFLWHANIQTIDIIDEGKSDVIIRGQLSKGIYNGELHKKSPRYALILRKHPMHLQCLNLSLQIESDGDSHRVEANQSHFISSNTTADDVFMGFGHRLSTPNAKGMEVRVSNSCKKGKQGYASKEMQEGGAGSLVVPHFVTNTGASFFLTTPEPSVFDLQHDDWFSVRVQSSVLKGTWIAANSALEAMGIHASLQGRVKKMPMWTQNGAMLGLSGGTFTVRRIHKALKERSCPISGVVISDWTGIKPKSNRMWYNWVLERELYPNWKRLVDDLENDGVNVGLYINPCLDEIPPHLRSGRRYIFGEAEDHGYFIKDPNTKGVYNFGNDKASCGVLDMTNQDAVNWFKETIIGGEVLGRAGAWMIWRMMVLMWGCTSIPA